MTEPLYKVLDLDGTAHNGGRGQWMLPANGQLGAWMPPIVGELIPCQHGYHLCRRQDVILWLGPTIWLAEGRGDQIIHTNKIVVREARLLRRFETWTERTARLFACECAERALKRERAAGREPAEASWQSITVARRFASGTATVEELSAARAAASAAAWAADRADSAAASAAAWAADRAADSAAAWAAARAADSAAASAAAWAAASAAAWAAASAAASAADSAADSAAAWAAERDWQTERLFQILEGDLPAVKVTP